MQTPKYICKNYEFSHDREDMISAIMKPKYKIKINSTYLRYKS